MTVDLEKVSAQCERSFYQVEPHNCVSNDLVVVVNLVKVNLHYGNSLI